MDVTMRIPDDLAVRLGTEGDLSRRALEALALQEYKSGHLGKADLLRLLGFTTRYELDGFLKAHAVWTDYTIEGSRHEREDLRRLGF
jgi:hypothetical protein